MHLGLVTVMTENMHWSDILDDVRREPTYTNHCRALQRLRAATHVPPGSALRVAVLSNFTVEPIMTCLQVQGYLNALPIELYVAPYNEQAQEILDTRSGLHRFGADIVVLLLTPRAIMRTPPHEPWPNGANGMAELHGLLRALRAETRATVLVSNFVTHEASSLGLLDWQTHAGVERTIEALNHALSDYIQTQERMYIFDLAGLCAAFGRERAFDPRMRLLADQPFAASFVPRVATELIRYFQATKGPSRKCVVLDLDNTLWGGILGEDGAERLRLGGDAVGEAYREFQLAILALHARGILLALCSRNDEREAMAVIRDHPGMVLRPDHFAAIRVNWKDKVSNLQSLAAELNIGLDSLVFMDDDPFECQSVRERLPQVMVVQLGCDPTFYRTTLLQLRAFDTLSITAEDRDRGRMYQERRARERLREGAASLEQYLSALEMEITAVPALGPSRTRLFQLVHKTNQFNLTARRYNENEFDSLTRAPDYRVFGIAVRDRLGDSGIVGLVVLRLVNEVCEIETFLLSCRVLGRSIETGVLAYTLELARAEGSQRIRGYYVPTQKNGLVSDFYRRHGLTFVGHHGPAESWEAELAEFQVTAPVWAQVSKDSNREADR